MKSNISLQWLRTFKVAAEQQSFTRAAQVLSLTQAAVSKQMRSLEMHLKQPLFNRLAHGLSLTEMGQHYLIEVKAALNALDTATEDLFGLRQKDTVKLRTNIAFAHWLLVERLPDLYLQNPGLKLELSHSVWDVSHEPVSGDIDVRYGLEPWPGLCSIRLTRDSLYAAGATNASIENAPALINVLGYRYGWQWYAEQTQQPKILRGQQLSVDNSVIAYPMAAEGLGLVLARSSFMQNGWAKTHLVDAGLPHCKSDEGYFALCTDPDRLSPMAQAVWEWLGEQDLP